MAIPFRKFVSHDIRTGPVLKWLLPWNWMRPTTQVEALAARYEQDLIQRTLPQLPSHPRFIFCATDLVFGVNWVFEREQIGDYQAGYMRPAPSWPVAQAVAASSCFPPVFNPWIPPVRPEQLVNGKYPPGEQRDRLISAMKLSDGGVYDNMGLEPVWKDHAVVLVSDGGAPFGFEASETPLRVLTRYLSIVDNQSASLRKRWLISNFQKQEMSGTYWGIRSDTKGYSEEQPPPGYSDPLVKTVISTIRTDLDSFTEPEIAVLENHGYLLANAATSVHMGNLIRPDAPPVQVPHPDWMDEEKVRTALKESYKRFKFNILRTRLWPFFTDQ